MDFHQTKGQIRSRSYEIMLNYISENQRMLSRKLDESFNKADKEKHWAILTRLLNKEDPDTAKPLEKWRKDWQRWKNYVKIKAKKYGTRGLSFQEKRLYDLTEKVQKDGAAYTSEEIPNSNVSSEIMHEQKALKRTISLDSIYTDVSNSDASIEELCKETPLTKKPCTSRKGVEPNQLVGKRFNFDGEAESKITEELKKGREIDEQKMKVLQQMAEGQAKLQSTLLQIAKTLDKMSSEQEKLVIHLRDTIYKTDS